jgi:hypothetical protein
MLVGLAPSPHRPALPPAFKSLPASSGPPYPQDTFFSMIPHWPWIQIRKIPQAVKHIIFRPQVADVPRSPWNIYRLCWLPFCGLRASSATQISSRSSHGPTSPTPSRLYLKPLPNLSLHSQAPHKQVPLRCGGLLPLPCHRLH